MLNVLEASVDELMDFIEEERKNRAAKNKEQINDYYLKNHLSNDNNISYRKYDYKYEEQIVFMIKHSASLKFIVKYFNISEKYVRDISIKHKCQSYLLSDITENVNARCFSKNQIIRSCEDFNYICPMCFRPLDISNFNTLTGHHILPFARGGKTTKDNCLPLHVSCHFDDFKLLHSVLFDSSDPIYSAKYFNSLKEKLQQSPSGMDQLLKKIKNN